MRLVSGASTDKGQVREGNEDAYIVDRRLRLFAVADGMGGHRGGEVASATALEALRATVASGAQIDDAIAAANTAVYGKAADDDELRGMGTTLTAAMPDEAGLVIGHVGDSRAYLLRDGELRQLTLDHSLVEELVREGRLTAEQAATHPQRSVITRALGVDGTVDVDVYAITLTPADRVLLCSDGLTTMLRDDDIAAILRREPDPTRAANALVDAANAAGGEDNITTVVIDVEMDRVDPMPASVAAALTTEPGASGDQPAGTTSPDPAAPGQPDAAPGVPELLAETPRQRQRRPRRHVGRSVWRGVRFSLPILLILGLAFGAVAWFARRTYYVGFDRRGTVVIYQGRPGGLLLWDPTVLRRTALTEGDLTDDARLAIADDKEFSNRGDAVAYVAGLEARATAATSTTTTTTTTTPATVPGAPSPPPVT